MLDGHIIDHPGKREDPTLFACADCKVVTDGPKHARRAMWGGWASLCADCAEEWDAVDEAVATEGATLKPGCTHGEGYLEEIDCELWPTKVVVTAWCGGCDSRVSLTAHHAEDAWEVER